MPKQGFTISTDKSKLDLDYIHDYLANHSYWAAHIPKATVQKSIEGSECFGVYYQDQQVGFGRVVTDKATFAYLCDVFIDKEYRGDGLGKWLIQTIMADSRLQGLRRWMLGTRDAHGLYEKSGFTALADPLRVMHRLDPDVYKKNKDLNGS
jgi:GNAT superfamily N-acetyltransferase